VIRVLALILFCSGSASAAQLSLELGRYGTASHDDLAPGGGTLVRLGLAGSRAPHERVELAAEGRLGSALNQERSVVGVGWTGLSVRYTRELEAVTVATPFLGLGFDLGVDGHRRDGLLETDGLALSGHLVTGLRLPISDLFRAFMTLVVSLDGAAVPSLATTLGLETTVEL
jgi:hypothetical protein